MKKIACVLLLTSLALGFMTCSCQQDPVEDPNKEEQKPDPKPDPKPEPEPEPEPEGPQPGTYKFEASPMKGAWKAGDQIYVHGNLGTLSEVVTLSAADISADGKTATAQLGEVTGSAYEPDGLYAAWPAENVYQFKGILKIKTTFERCEGLLTQAYLTDDTFKFIDVSALISFTADGDYDSWAICSNDRNGICITKFESEYSSEKKAFNYKQNDGYPFLYGSVASGAGKVFLPGDFSFPKGYTLYLGKGDEWTASFTYTNEQKLTAGQTLELGNITSLLTPYTGPAPKMPRQGAQTKYTVQFNELSGICVAEDGSFLWTVGDDGDLAKLDLEGNVTYKFHIGGDAEDVSINPETQDLLIGLEPDGVGVVKAPNYNARVSTLFSLAACKNYGNSGIEGLTYYKDGMVFAGAQSNSHLFLCDLATKSVLWETRLYDVNRVSEVAGLSYDPLSGWLWIVDSEAKKIFVFAIDHTVADGKWDVNMQYIGAYPVAGSNPESVCVDRKNNCVWVGDDYGSTSYLYRYEFSGFEEFDRAK